MKTKSFYFVTRLVAAVTIVLTSFSASSCDKDEDDDPGRLVGGRWELTWLDGVSTESYEFNDNGYGFYSDPYKYGSFLYSIDSPGNIRIKITYIERSSGGSHKDEFVWPYSIRGDKLILNGNTYTRKEVKIIVT